MLSIEPSRKILTQQDLDRFLISECFKSFLQFLQDLNQSVRGKSCREPTVVTQNISNLVDILDKIASWIKEIPPISTKSRFGNPAFQQWYDRLDANLSNLFGFIPSNAHEISIYFLHSFGNKKRIDYGTGHEANFIAFLYCLVKIGHFNSNDYDALVLIVFQKYIKVMRVLQLEYWLEPAGSHGVWGLDDYHFLPFYFGSSQLATHKYFRPKSIHDKEIIQEFAQDYLYFECIQFINTVKTASLRWHSPMLDDISGVKTWEKVNQGMMKMYAAEVLGKLPIMQHFLFGTLLEFEGNVHSGHDDIGHDHVHAFGQEHPGCCSIRVPSSIAVSKAESKLIPFD